MKGDFSKLDFNPLDNFTGVLHQQGRALLDQDWNAAGQIAGYLRQLQGRDTIGPRIAAVPADAHESFKVVQAEANSGSINITLHPGRVWVDGLVLQISGAIPYTRQASYLGPPIQDPQANPATITAGVCDAVILEVWEEAFNAFQDPLNLIEPALGGVDTTERVKLFHDLRLLRLGPGDECGNLADRLADDFSAKGRLTVTPADTLAISGECPVEVGGGYTGFEHYLYRIEVTDPDTDDNARFKWSRFDGGLVGRGTYNSTESEITVTANDQMINHCGLTSFYLEALQEDTEGGPWQIKFTADATLSADGKLSLTNIDGTWPGGTGEAFFRLWDGIRLISDYPIGLPAANELENGILLAFEASASDNNNYTPGDYWTFPVRAAGVDFDPSVWPDNAPPQGVHYHRVPLAILEWDAAPATTVTAPSNIRDCRHVFQPLTQWDCCCAFTVGDGTHSTGDFQSIEEAINNLPATGGEICLLAGLHTINATMENRHNITIKGCGWQTKVVPAADASNIPIFQIKDSTNIVLEHMEITTFEGSAIIMEGSDLDLLKDIAVRHNRILACEQAIRVMRGIRINIHNNNIRMLDKEGGDVAVYMQAEDSAIERNDIMVVPADKTPPIDQPDNGATINPIDPCARFDRIFTNARFFYAYTKLYWGIAVTATPENPYTAIGGVQVAGSSERITIRDNRINGGAGNGITLGGQLDLSSLNEGEEETPEEEYTVSGVNGYIIGATYDESGTPLAGIQLSFINAAGQAVSAVTNDGAGFAVETAGGANQIVVTSPGYEIANINSITLAANKYYMITLKEIEIIDEPPIDDPFGFIYELRIESNRIFNMGLCGIGVPQSEIVRDDNVGDLDIAGNRKDFLRLTKKQSYNYGLVSVIGPKQLSSVVIGLDIYRNQITHCLKTPFVVAMRDKARFRGYGGIVLLMCENVSIRENRIENNGRSHIEPVCGIIARGNQIEVSGNHIANNGPLTANPMDADIVPGIRGGIVLHAFSMSISSKLDSTVAALKTRSGFAGMLQSNLAARVHDNIVSQPAGPALGVVAIGALSILNNRFYSQMSGPISIAGLSENMGTVYIANIGRGNAMGHQILTQVDTGGASGSETNTNSEDTAAGEGTERLRSGIRINTNINRLSVQQGVLGHYYGQTTLFNNNQIRLGMARNCPFSILITSLGDIGFAANQCDVDTYDTDLMLNTYLLGATLRATDNRFIEMSAVDTVGLSDIGETEVNMATNNVLMMEYSNMTVGAVVGAALTQIYPLSLLSLGYLVNITSHNQGYHCIIALPQPVPNSNVPTVFIGNQMPVTETCGYLGQLIVNVIAGTSQDVLSLLR